MKAIRSLSSNSGGGGKENTSGATRGAAAASPALSSFARAPSPGPSGRVATPSVATPAPRDAGDARPLSRATYHQLDRFAELNAELERRAIIPSASPSLSEIAHIVNEPSVAFSPSFTIPETVQRTLDRREVRIQLTDDTDRKLPAHKHALRLRQQLSSGYDLLKETNAMLDSKSTVATVLHQYKDECRARDGVERQVARWSERLLDDANFAQDQGRLRAIEVEDEVAQAGEAAVARGTSALAANVETLGVIKNAIATATEKVRTEQALMARRNVVKSMAINTDMTFDCGFHLEEAQEAGESTESAAGNGDGELLLLAERRLQRRSDALHQALSLLHKKDRELRELNARIEVLMTKAQVEQAQHQALLEASTTGLGFTSLWAMVDNDLEGGIDAKLQSVLMAALERAQQQVNQKATAVSSEVQHTQERVENIEKTDQYAALLKDRNENRTNARHAAQRIEALKRELQLKEEIISDKDNAIRSLTGQVESVKRVAVAHQEDLSRKATDHNAFRVEISTLEGLLEKERIAHLEELRMAEERHRKREEELTAQWLRAMKEADQTEQGLENRISIKTSNLSTKAQELEELLKTTKEVSQVATTRVDQLTEQLDLCCSAITTQVGTVVGQLTGALSQVRSFHTAGDLDALRQCVWRGLNDALTTVGDLVRHESFATYAMRDANFRQISANITTAARIELPKTKDDPRVAALSEQLQNMEMERNTLYDDLNRQREEHFRMQEKYRKALLHMKRAVVNLVSRRNAEMQALPSSEAADPSGESESALNDIFRQGFQQLEDEETERATEISQRKEENARARMTIIELADSTALPVRQLVATMSNMCATLRGVTGVLEKWCAPIVQRRTAEARSMSNAPSGDLSLVASITQDLAGIKSKNNKLIVESVQARARAKARITLYTRRFQAAEDSKRDLVRRRMNHCEIVAFKHFTDIYARFTKLHEDKCEKLARLLSITGQWALKSPDALVSPSSRLGSANLNATFGGVSLPPAAVERTASPAGSVPRDVPRLPSQQGAMNRSVSIRRVRQGVGSPSSPPNDAGSTGVPMSPGGLALADLGPTLNDSIVMASPMLKPAPGNMVYDAAITSGTFLMGESETVDAARADAKAAAAAYSLLKTVVADAFMATAQTTGPGGRHEPKRRFAVLVADHPGSSGIANAHLEEMELLHAAMLTTLAARSNSTPTSPKAGDAPHGAATMPSLSSSIIRSAPSLLMPDDMQSGPASPDAAAATSGGAASIWFALRHAEIAQAQQHAAAQGDDDAAIALMAAPPAVAIPQASQTASVLRHHVTASAAPSVAQMQCVTIVPIEFDQFGFARRVDDAQHRAAAAANRPKATTVQTAHASTSTDMSLLADFILQLLRERDTAHPSGGELVVVSNDIDPGVACAARVLPWPCFGIATDGEARSLADLSKALGTFRTLTEPQRFVAPAVRPTSATKKSGGQQTAPTPIRAASVEPMPGTVLPPRVASTLPQVNFPAVLEIAVPAAHAAYAKALPDEVLVYPPHRHSTDLPTNPMYAAIANCLDRRRGAPATPPTARPGTAATAAGGAPKSNLQRALDALPERLTDDKVVGAVVPSVSQRLRSGSALLPSGAARSSADAAPVDDSVSWAPPAPLTPASAQRPSTSSVLPAAAGKKVVVMQRRGADRSELRTL